jgi:hypothetical protein
VGGVTLNPVGTLTVAWAALSGEPESLVSVIV